MTAITVKNCLKIKRKTQFCSKKSIFHGFVHLLSKHTNFTGENRNNLLKDIIR